MSEEVIKGEVVTGASGTASGRPTHAVGGSPPAPGTSDALVPVDDPGYTYRPQLVLSPEDASTLVAQVTAMQRSVLKPGVDYDRIPGTRGSPVLLKPGAERLLQVFGLGHSLERIEVDPDPEGGHWGVWYKCTVTKTLLDGREIVVSSCEGYASYDETKFWDRDRKSGGQKKSPWNTLIKMAQKRALVGATLTATATSGLFTQDMEDYQHEHPRQPAPQEGGAAPEYTDADRISVKQVQLVQTLFSNLRVTDREDRLRICSEALEREVTSTKDLTRGEASTLIDHLKSLEAAV